MIARKEIPEKHQKIVLEWWKNWIDGLLLSIAVETEYMEDFSDLDEAVNNLPQETKDRIDEAANAPVLSFQEILDLAKGGASRRKVEYEMDRKRTLTPGQRSIIDRKIKDSI